MSTRYSKPVRREMPVEIKDGSKPRALIAILHGNMLELKLKGRRSSEFIDLEGAFFGAIKARVFRTKMEKAKARAAKRGNRLIAKK